MIEVGEYVRTKKGVVGKFKKYLKSIYFEGQDIELENCIIYLEDEDEVVKHSKNIIDLIEVGDYIQLEDRGERFYEVTTDYQGKLAIIDIGWNEYEEIDETYNQDIKSIVTSEQFKSIEYRLED